MLFKKNNEKLEVIQEKCINELLIFINNFSNNMIRKLYEIQDVQTLGIAEAEKNKQRNILINKTIKDLNLCADKIKELVQRSNQN